VTESRNCFSARFSASSALQAAGAL